MKIVYGLGNFDFRQEKGAVLTMGIFDGLHLGHQYLIKKAVKRAIQKKTKSILLTFSPHPARILNSRKYLPYLMSLYDRLKLIESLGITICVVQEFSKSLSNVKAADFIRQVNDKMNPSEIIIGDDFTFGKNRQGNVEFLKKSAVNLGFKISIVRRLKAFGKVVSSTKIRNYVQKGNLKLAAQLLGRNFSVSGKVVRGNNIGKHLGFPTANLLPFQEVIPPYGIYVVRINLRDRIYRGLCYIGSNPTIKKVHPITSIEVYIIDFRKNIYGKDLKVEFLKKLRDEKSFNSKDELVSQMKEDLASAKTYFKT